jgi:cytochrome c oxidase cbb3-type subunit 4
MDVGAVMNVGTLGAISTVLVTIAFFGVCYWAFSPKLKKRFEEDAKLPFADDIENKQTDHHQP